MIRCLFLSRPMRLPVLVFTATVSSLLLSGCVMTRPAPVPEAPVELRVIVHGGNGTDTQRIVLSPPSARPTLPRAIVPAPLLDFVRANAAAATDTGAAVLLLREGPGSGVTLAWTRARHPAAPPSAPPTMAPDSACTSLTAFFLSGVGRPAARPVIVEAGQSARIAVDPRRHTLRLTPVMRLRTDTFPAPAGPHRLAQVRLMHGTHARLLVVRRDTAGALLSVRTAAAGELTTVVRDEGQPIDWSFYLLDDRTRHHSPCRERRASAFNAPGRIASNIDSTLAPYGLPPLRSVRVGRGERELRLMTGGGMMYEPEYVVRIVAQRGRVHGEMYEWWRSWPRKPHSGGPQNREKRPPEPHGCLQPRRSQGRWVCRIDRMIPVDWRRVLARLDSLRLDELPPQEPDGFVVTDQEEVTIETARRGRYNGVYYYGPSAVDATEARAQGVDRVLRDLIAGRMAVAPDSLPRLRPVAPGGLSIPGGVVMVVRDARTWRDLWTRFPGRARRGEPRAVPPRIDFDREALVVIGQSSYKAWDCPWPADYVRRAEARADTAYVVLDDSPPRKRWPPPCDPDSAPVQVLAVRVPRGTPVVLVHTSGRYREPERLPRAAPP